ncbi:DNA polymerase iota isoform X2 [Nerophis lumbriciformis]|uniref:DNA polymerase iota isoform X2 n=1 Tax=Nerophis lumbriciformis TaxID=546530 RepID=UPI002ADF87B6|nr:DNA polymerase iota-like isoform X2 [Nerophis lumbriciformis]
MESSEDEAQEDETEWEQDMKGSPFAVSGSNFLKTPTHKVILHFDLDCFYAQVEMLRNPALRDVPLGIQQKYIIVTCNYVARQQGVTKLMSVTDAKEKCPRLVLVKGEDLTHYREMSYQVTDLLLSFCPSVERLGFDENYVDVTEMIEKRRAHTPQSSFSFKGHVYNIAGDAADAKANSHAELALGSHIAAELREAIHSRLGLTGCAGIAANKLLAKLVSGAFKPNQQTTLLPENVGDIMGALSGPRAIPGVGHQTAKRLHALGLVSVRDLQLFPLTDLVREFGAPSATRLKNLSLGVDNSPVTPSGAPQSLSDEDSFKKMSTAKEVMEKMKQLLSSLVERMRKDGRQPQTLRLTVRKYSATNKWHSRESRQCPIPHHIGRTITSAGSDDTVLQLVSLAMKLFSKILDINTAFHLTLINVCFSNLQAKGPSAGGRSSIKSFFAHGSSPKPFFSSPQRQAVPLVPRKDKSSPCGAENGFITSSVTTPEKTTKSPPSCDAATLGAEIEQRASVPADASQDVTSPSSTTCRHQGDAAFTVTHGLPPNVDAEVFRVLPVEIQNELLMERTSEQCHLPSNPTLTSPQTSGNTNNTEQGVVYDLDPSEGGATPHQRQPAGKSAIPGETTLEEKRLSSDCQLPLNVDPKVFSQLPADLQAELMTEWKQQKPLLKVKKAARAKGKKEKTKFCMLAPASSSQHHMCAEG